MNEGADRPLYSKGYFDMFMYSSLLMSPLLSLSHLMKFCAAC